MVKITLVVAVVLTKLVVVVLATVVLLLQLQPLAVVTEAATSTPPRDVGAATASLVLHSAGGLGMTRYGLRRAVRS
jgi:hypothetical protein